jgi:hypothetical protein
MVYHHPVARGDDFLEGAQTGVDRLGGGLVTEQLVERRAPAHVGEQDRSFLGDESHCFW